MNYLSVFSGVENLGNSMAVPVMRWIGERILIVENVFKGLQC